MFRLADLISLQAAEASLSFPCGKRLPGAGGIAEMRPWLRIDRRLSFEPS
jgi:hypothetical protein